MHEKILLTDNAALIIGSQNLSTASLLENRELSLALDTSIAPTVIAAVGWAPPSIPTLLPRPRTKGTPAVSPRPNPGNRQALSVWHYPAAGRDLNPATATVFRQRLSLPRRCSMMASG